MQFLMIFFYFEVTQIWQTSLVFEDEQFSQGLNFLNLNKGIHKVSQLVFVLAYVQHLVLHQ